MSGYLAALESVGLRTIVSQDIGCYQGDIVALVFESRYSYQDTYHDSSEPVGFVVIGFGSCSGCDAWEAATTAKERLAILSSIVERVIWFDDFTTAQQFVIGAPIYADNDRDQYGNHRWDEVTHPYRDHKLEWYGHETEWPEFVQAVKDFSPLY